MNKMVRAGFCLACVAWAAGGMGAVDPMSWSAVDGLGRFLPEQGTVGAPRKDKWVGIFYWTWHGDYSNSPSNAVNRCWDSKGRGIGTINVQDVMDRHPEAKNDYNHPAWRNICRDGKVGSGHWAEPIWGYYYSSDEWVARRHGLLFADAGIDAVVFDTTNGIDMWEEGYMTVGRVFTRMRREGTPVPGFAFMMPIGSIWSRIAHEWTRKQLHMVWEKVYSKGLFRDVWFMWKGKPLVLAHPEALDPNDPLDRKLLDFFTFRPVQPLYCEGQSAWRKWGWLATHPQAVYTNPDGTPEQITVGVAQNICQESVCKYAATDEGGYVCHGLSYAMNGEEVFGRSYTSKGFDPRPDAKLYGANFQEQWDRAIKVDPEFVFVTGWNEWISGPKPFREVPNGFSDQFDEEHSRDCEPSKGNLKDHYYYQLCANIRRFKGVSSVASASATNLGLGSSAADWEKKGTAFCDWKKDLSARNAKGYYKYSSDTGRNALETARVSHDADFVYFEAVSPKALSPVYDPNWMRLLIRNNREGATWEGFQFIVNRLPNVDGREAVLERSLGGWKWTKVCACECRVDANRLVVKIPRRVLGVATPKFELRFKWCDNNIGDGDILSVYTDGDAMPGGRFTFRYVADDLSSDR